MLEHHRQWGWVAALVVVGLGILSSTEAKACGGGGASALAVPMVDVALVGGFVGFTALDVAAAGEGHGAAYGFFETLWGGTFTYVFASLASGDSDGRLGGDEVMLGALALWSAGLMAHGMYTVVNPRVDRAGRAHAISIAPAILEDRGKAAYGLSFARTF